MIVRLKDIMAAEERLDEAITERTEFARNQDRWFARESLDEHGHKGIHFSRGHFDMLERLDANVQAAENQLRALQRSFAGGA